MDITEWQTSYSELPSVGVGLSATVEGACKKGRGGRFLYAKVRLKFSPADELTFYCSEVNESLTAEGFSELLQSIYLGVLDVMLVKPESPVTVFKCSVDDMDVHPVDSSPRAFRLAARAAAEEFIAQDSTIAI